MIKKKYEKKSFESDMSSSDTSANIYESMLTSDAWKSLTSNQKALYQACKAQYYAEKKKPFDNREYFTMNKSKWMGKYGLYNKGNEGGFYRDISALIEKGFISCISTGAFSRTKSIYSFSDKWKKYGTPEFSISHEEMNLRLMRKLRKEQNERE